MLLEIFTCIPHDTSFFNIDLGFPESLESVAPTVGFSSAEFKFNKKNILIYDLGGGKKIRDIWKNYFSEVYGLIYVVDSSEPGRLKECKGVLKSLVTHPKVAGKPILL